MKTCVRLLFKCLTNYVSVGSVITFLTDIFLHLRLYSTEQRTGYGRGNRKNNKKKFLSVCPVVQCPPHVMKWWEKVQICRFLYFGYKAHPCVLCLHLERRNLVNCDVNVTTLSETMSLLVLSMWREELSLIALFMTPLLSDDLLDLKFTPSRWNIIYSISKCTSKRHITATKMLSICMLLPVQEIRS